MIAGIIQAMLCFFDTQQWAIIFLKIMVFLCALCIVGIMYIVYLGMKTPSQELDNAYLVAKSWSIIIAVAVALLVAMYAVMLKNQYFVELVG